MLANDIMKNNDIMTDSNDMTNSNYMTNNDIMTDNNDMTNNDIVGGYAIKLNTNKIPCIVNLFKYINGKKLSLVKKLVFVGDVSDNIKKDLKIFSNKMDKTDNKSVNRLDSYFGKGWCQTILNNKKHDKKLYGGKQKLDKGLNAEIKLDDLLDNTLENESGNMTFLDLVDDSMEKDQVSIESDDDNELMELSVESKSELSVKSEKSEESAESAEYEPIKSVESDQIESEQEIHIEDLFQSSDEIEKSSNILHNQHSIKNNSKNKLLNRPENNQTESQSMSGKVNLNLYDYELEFIDTAIWSLDNPLDLKYKIYYATGIPITHQNLTFEHNYMIRSLHYLIYNNNKIINEDLKSLLIDQTSHDISQVSSTNINVDFYEGIPILNKYYAARSGFKVEALDTFSIMSDFYNKLGIVEYDLYNLDDFLSVWLNNKAKTIKSQIELIYYGFIILFFPIITLEIFNDMVGIYKNNESANNNFIKELAKIYPDILPNISVIQNKYKMQNNFNMASQDLQINGIKVIKELEKHIYISISQITLQNFIFNDSKVAKLSLRDIFDQFELTPTFSSVKYTTLFNNKKLVLHKTYHNSDIIISDSSIDSILIQGDLPQTLCEICLYKNGNYYVKFIIKDTEKNKQLDNFDNILKFAENIINLQIIKPISHMKNVTIQNYIIANISKHTVNFVDIVASIFYRQSFSDSQLSVLKQILNDYVIADIFNQETTNMGFDLVYYLKKGNYQQDKNRIFKYTKSTLINTYEYLSKDTSQLKWSKLYINNKKIYVNLQKHNIKYHLVGIRDAEFEIIYNYMLTMLYVMHLNKIGSLNQITNLPEYREKKEIKFTLESDNLVKTLKYQDPILYDFKKYNSNMIYSKICQKPNQPKILTDNEANKLSKSDKSRVVKFWNYTTNIPINYYCPNSKYPYINFIVKKHPTDACIPCCKITKITGDSNSLKHKIHKQCLVDHKYSLEKKNLIVETRYVMGYGKYIEPGRLCNLPENTLEPLFYESYSNQNGTEDECYKNNRYYLMGIDQHFGTNCTMGAIQNVGFINIILLILDISFDQFLTLLKQNLIKNSDIFDIILNGEIRKYFYDIPEFLNTIQNLFTGNSYVNEKYMTIPWNSILMDILYYYFNIITIEFYDSGWQRNSDEIFLKNEQDDRVAGDDIVIVLNNRLSNPLVITNPKYKILIVLSRHVGANNSNKTIINPIFYINSIVYFKTRLITNKVYELDMTINKILFNMLSYIKENSNSKDKAQITDNSYYATLSSVNLFIEHHTTKYNIQEYYINKHNMCYYIGIFDYESRKIIYMPIVETEITNDNGIYKPLNKYTKFDILNRFLTKFNEWHLAQKIEQLSEKIAISTDKSAIISNTLTKSVNKANFINKALVNVADYGIHLQKWIGQYKSAKIFNDGGLPQNICGFIFSGMNYYFTPISLLAAKKIKNVPIIPMFYDIEDVNNQIYNENEPTSDPRNKGISQSFYEYYLYQLFILEFVALFGSEKNIKIRTSIKKEILSIGISSSLTVTKNSNSNNLTSIFNNINIILDNYYSNLNIYAEKNKTNLKKTNSKNMLVDNYLSYDIPKQQDFSNIVELINASLIEFKNKNEIYDAFDMSNYNFDKMAINQFKTQPKELLIAELHKLSKKIVKIGKLKLNNKHVFPNILSDCSVPSPYCSGNKLIIEQSKLNDLIDILADDIKNPLKEKWIFSMIFSDNIVNFMKFIQRPGESITVEID